jgi:UDP-N-acetylglucosamine--N-acetylmuramyl-(pentapeptide) pyrophosphoryl-undecaprenol N-acetylglucosamine transferase
MKDHKIIIAVGGTGGHLFPAQQLKKQLKDSMKEVILAGDNSRFSSNLKQKFYRIYSSRVKKSNLLLAALKIFCGVIQSIKLIKKFKPNLIISFGSFYCFPILCAAKFLKIPYIIYEPNVVCGVVNRLFSKKALALLSQFEEIKNHQSKNIIISSFLPWRPIKQIAKEEVRDKINLKKDCFTILVYGGSQGALFLNQKIFKLINQIKIQDIQLMHITGSDNMTKILNKKYRQLGIKAYVASFVKDIPFLCQGADLAICRSGAATIGELIQTSTPSILVPYPFATDNHQYQNAKILQDIVKGAKLYEQKNLTDEKFIQAIDSLLDNNFAKLHLMQKNLRRYYMQNHTKRKSPKEIIEKLCKEKTITF